MGVDLTLFFQGLSATNATSSMCSDPTCTVRFSTAFLDRPRPHSSAPTPTPTPTLISSFVAVGCHTQVDLREMIALMQSYGEVKQQHPFPQHRSSSSSSSGRIAPCATGVPAGISGTRSGAVLTGSSIANDVVHKK